MSGPEKAAHQEVKAKVTPAPASEPMMGFELGELAGPAAALTQLRALPREQVKPATLKTLQRSVGNGLVQRLLSEKADEISAYTPEEQDETPDRVLNEPPPGLVQRSPGPVVQRSFILDGQLMTTFAELAAWYPPRIMRLVAQRAELAGQSLAVPADIQTVIDQGLTNAANVQAGGTEEADDVSVEEAGDWWENCGRVFNEGEAIKAEEAARRLDAASAALAQVSANIENVMIPRLRDKQRALFKAEDTNGLVATADLMATILNTSLIASDVTNGVIQEVSNLRMVAGTARASRAFMTVNTYAAGVLEKLSSLDKLYAKLSLVRAGYAMLCRSQTSVGGAMAGVSAMSTVAGSGGTLLGASAGFTLYCNIYIGPMVSAILTTLSQAFDNISRTENRQAMENGEFDLVKWELEPGGRATFEFMLAVMRAGGPGDIPAVPESVSDLFTSNQSEMEAGTGGRSEMPTQGILYWEEVDPQRIAQWVFSNRQNIWNMLYGATTPPV